MPFSNITNQTRFQGIETHPRELLYVAPSITNQTRFQGIETVAPSIFVYWSFLITNQTRFQGIETI